MKKLIIGFIAIAILTQCNSKQEIAQWRGPERNGVYPGDNLLTLWPEKGPKLIWRYDSLGLGYSSPAVVTHRVYAVGTVDSVTYIFSFDHYGKFRWKTKLGKDWTKNWPGIRSTPTIYKGLGYVLNGIGILYCFDAEKGNIVWSKDIIREYSGRIPDFGLCENLMIDGDKLFCTPGGIDINVVALNRYNGDLIWKNKGNSDSIAYSNPILIETGGKKFFINQTQKFLNSFDAETGTLEWSYGLKEKSHPNTPIYRDSFLFVVDGFNAGSFKLKVNKNGKGVKEVWKNKDIQPVQGDIVLLGDRLYAVCGRATRFSSIDWNTGKELYSDSIHVEVINVISAENLIYSYALRGEFLLLKPGEKGFEKLGSFRVNGGSNLHCSHPVIKDGRLYVRHDNSLFVYDIAK
jgi:outer membrane protein assembly factor BamB